MGQKPSLFLTILGIVLPLKPQFSFSFFDPQITWFMGKNLLPARFAFNGTGILPQTGFSAAFSLGGGSCKTVAVRGQLHSFLVKPCRVAPKADVLATGDGGCRVISSVVSRSIIQMETFVTFWPVKVISGSRESKSNFFHLVHNGKQ